MNPQVLALLAWLESAVLFAVRLVVGGAFAASGVIKLMDLQQFALSISKFELLDPVDHEHLVRLATYTLPWTELVAGAMLVVGVVTRGAALLTAALLGLFLFAILSALQRDLAIDCGCFGKTNFPCQNPINICHVVRNVVLIAGAVLLLWRGGGLIAVEALGDDPAARFGRRGAASE